jgi:hypothetical protein
MYRSTEALCPSYVADRKWLSSRCVMGLARYLVTVGAAAPIGTLRTPDDEQLSATFGGISVTQSDKAADTPKRKRTRKRRQFVAKPLAPTRQ